MFTRLRLHARSGALCATVALVTTLLGVGLATPAQAAVTNVFTATFEDCPAPTTRLDYPNEGTAGGSIRLSVSTLRTGDFAACGWSASGQTWLATYVSGTPFPSPTKAVWLNEGAPRGVLSRTVTGLTTGKQYRVSVVAWTDNIDAATALGFSAGPVNLVLPMAARSGQQSLSTTFCAADPSIGLRLQQSGSSGSSPIIDNVIVDDMGVYCALTATDDTASVRAGTSGTVNLTANDTATGGVPVPVDSVVSLQPGGTATGTTTLAGGVLSYAPTVAEIGSTVTVPYRVCPPDTTGTPPCSTATARITVTAPPPPVAPNVTSTGVGTALQSVTLTAPAGGSATLVDADGLPIIGLDVNGGRYALDAATGIVTFTPVLGIAGPATPVGYRITDSLGRTATGTYTPTVTPPAAPAPPALTSTGVGTAVQTATVDLTAIPVGGSLTFVDRLGNPATSPYDEYSGAGVFTYDPTTGVFTYTPAPFVSGEVAYPAGYRITDAYGQSTTATYTPTVQAPPGPSPTELSSEGPQSTPQTVTLTLPESSELSGLALEDADGLPTDTVTVTGGVYTLVSATGVLTFTPDDGYSGTPDPVTYRVTDGYGTAGTSTYAPVVVAAPAPQTLGSTGVGTAAQTVTATVPEGGSISLTAGTDIDTLTVDAGVYTLDPAAGTITFVPALGFTGTAILVATVTDRFGQTGSVTVTAQVTAPAGPTVPEFTSTGVGTTPQTVTVEIPVGGSVTLLDGDTPVDILVVDGEGTYTLDPVLGVITFVPELGFDGTASGVSIRLTDAYDQSADGPWAPVVTAPAGPVAVELSSTGVGTAPQTVTVTVPPGGTVVLTDGDSVGTTLVVAGEGTYTVDPDTGVLTFTPVLGFAGAATPVPYGIVDAYGQVAVGVYSAIVTAPAAPATTALTSTAVGPQTQTVSLPVPTGGSVALLDGTTPVTTLTVAGQGTYVLDPSTGIVTFTPVAGFTGTATPVTYQVLDAYGTAATGTLTVTVTPVPSSSTPVTPLPVYAGSSVGGYHPTTSTVTNLATLAYTGTATGSLLGSGVVALLAGLALLVAVRRRPTGH